MDNPPWTDETPAEAPVRAAKAARAFWVTVTIIALVFAAMGIRRDRIPVFSVERTDDPLVFLAWPETCQQDARVNVVETSTEVVVTAKHNRHFCGGVGECAESVRFTLEAPLGDRQVIDGDRRVPVDVQEADVGA